LGLQLRLSIAPYVALDKVNVVINQVLRVRDLEILPLLQQQLVEQHQFRIYFGGH
jgi:hypothetical protein